MRGKGSHVVSKAQELDDGILFSVDSQEPALGCLSPAPSLHVWHKQ